MIIFPPQELQEYVKPTHYCDSDSPEIIAQARSLAEGCQSSTKEAMAVFYFVRDHFLFGLTAANQKASETLLEPVGWCVTKTNLQIALLRALGIPARYHQVVLTKKALKGYISRLMYRAIKEPIWFHPWCEVFLQGRWIACDLFLDQKTYQAARKAGVYTHTQIPTLDWDGQKDLLLVQPWMTEDRGVLASYDEVMEAVAKEFRVFPTFLVNALVNRSNRVTERFREKYA
jgi:hypothetical protein